jgi:hypothetical protein
MNFELNISRGEIKFPYKKYKNKKFYDKDVTIHLLQKKIFVKKYLCWFVYKESYVLYESMLEMIVGSTLSSSNIHEFANDNSNSYKRMVMDVMIMNQDYSVEGSCIILLDEESNVYIVRFLKLLEGSNELLWDEFAIHNELSAIAQIFTIKSNYRSSEASYDRILKWAKNMLPKGNRLKNNFYAAKSMMKSLADDTKKLIYVQTVSCYTRVNM